jgi:hypothetical protein
VRRLKFPQGFSLKTQFTLFFVLFVTAVYAVVLLTTSQQLAGITETISSELGIPIVEEAVALIDGDAFERLSRSLDSRDPFYEKTQRALAALKEETNCIYLYTMAPVGGDVFRYIIDGSAPLEDAENLSPLGQEEDIHDYREPILRAMESKKTQTSSIDFTARWGWSISTYTPILNSVGEAVGFVGCDFRADIYRRLWSQIVLELIVSGIFVIIGIAAYIYMINEVNKQNSRLLELTRAADSARESAEVAKDVAEAFREAAETTALALKDEKDTITAMKDALKVGIFFMDKNFIIQGQYSKALEEILSIRGLEGKKFTDLLSGQMKEERLKSLMEYFVLLFNQSRISSHNLNVKMLENLNPIQETVYIDPETEKEKILHCTFAPVDRGNGKLFILGNLQDITNEKKLQKQLGEEAAKSREEIGRLKEIIRGLQGEALNRA